MPKCVELLSCKCDWLISNLCLQAIEKVYLIKWPVSVDLVIDMYCGILYLKRVNKLNSKKKKKRCEVKGIKYSRLNAQCIEASLDEHGSLAPPRGTPRLRFISILPLSGEMRLSVKVCQRACKSGFTRVCKSVFEFTSCFDMHFGESQSLLCIDLSYSRFASFKSFQY